MQKQPLPNLAGYTWDEIQYRLVMDTLDASGGNVSEASRMVGIDRETLRRWKAKKSYVPEYVRNLRQSR